VTEQLDVLLFAALERWQNANPADLAAREVIATLQGPFDAPGMDPVYLLRLISQRSETGIRLFRGGSVLVDRFDKHTDAGIRSTSMEVGSEDDLTAALSHLAANA
jgi:hypothetical protein